MRFDLTPELIDQILFAMENQEEDFVVEADTMLVVPLSRLDHALFDDHRHYPVPSWDPSDGFRTMEAFCSQVKNPVYRTRLYDVLTSGRKVFRRYKETLRELPELESRWRRFKRSTMSEAIVVWYNTLREIWGLEQLAELPELHDDLVESEFSIVPLRDLPDGDAYLQHARTETRHELVRRLGETGARRRELQLYSLIGDDSQAICELGCTTPAGDIVGCIRVAKIPDLSAAEIELLFVDPGFRGVGLAQRLLEHGSEGLRSAAARRPELYCTLWGTGLSLEHTLHRLGAEPLSADYRMPLIEG